MTQPDKGKLHFRCPNARALDFSGISDKMSLSGVV